MSKYKENLTRLIGQTPLLKLSRIEVELGVEIMGKCEFLNPSGSLKDRILLHILTSAIREGKLRPGMTILEATTGNTGIATAMMGAYLGYPVVIVMPEGMSEERKKAICAFGAEILFTPGGESDVDLTLKKVQELLGQEPGKYFWVDQFNNPLNVEAHYRTTGPEIWEQTGGELDAFIASQGSAGTITGVARFLKEKKSSIKVYAIEPEECAILAGRGWGSHQIEGIGDGFVPSIFDLTLLDGVVLVSSKEAIDMAKRLSREEGLFVGISTGANVAGALKLKKTYPEFKRIVTMFNDHGFRYLSTALLGAEKVVEVPEREHHTGLTEEQKSILKSLEVIE